MRLIWKITLFLIAIVLTTLQPAFAQSTAPDRTQTQIAVLNAMSERFGRTLTITDISSRQWFFGSYDYVRGLGCPDSPLSAPVGGGWQRFEMTYQNTVYVYLVSDDAQNMVTCNEALLPTRSPSTTPVPVTTLTPIGSGASGSRQDTIPTATTTVSGSGASGGGQAVIPSATVSSETASQNTQPTSIPGCDLPVRLQIGIRGAVTPGEPNWIHSQPLRSSSKTGEIPGGEQFTVLDGPTCDSASGMNFWLVEYEAVVGWTSEGLDEYWLVPIEPIALSGENIERAIAPQWLNSYPRDARVLIEISPSSAYLLTGDDSGNVFLRAIENGEIVQQNNHQSAISAIAFSPDSRLFASGSADGMVIMSSTEAGASNTLTFQQDAPITALAFSSGNDMLLIIADDTGKLSFLSIADNTAPLIETQLTEPAGELEFSQDGRILLILNVDGYLINALTVPR